MHTAQRLSSSLHPDAFAIIMQQCVLLSQLNSSHLESCVIVLLSESSA